MRMETNYLTSRHHIVPMYYLLSKLETIPLSNLFHHKSVHFIAINKTRNNKLICCCRWIIVKLNRKASIKFSRYIDFLVYQLPNYMWWNYFMFRKFDNTPIKRLQMPLSNVTAIRIFNFVILKTWDLCSGLSDRSLPKIQSVDSYCPFVTGGIPSQTTSKLGF